MSASIPPFDRKRLRDVDLDISGIRVACSVWSSPRNHRTGGLVRIAGDYRHGSSGIEDAILIRWRLREFMELQRVDGLVVDCTELQYEWGDDLCLTPRQELKAAPLPMLVVVHPEQKEAFRYVVGDQSLRFSLDAALAEIAERIRGMKSRL